MKFKLGLIYEEGLRYACITMKNLDKNVIGKKRASIVLLCILRSFINRWQAMEKDKHLHNNLHKEDYNLNTVNMGEERRSIIYRDASMILHGFSWKDDKDYRTNKSQKDSIIPTGEKVEIKSKKEPIELYYYIIRLSIRILDLNTVKKILLNYGYVLLYTDDYEDDLDALNIPVTDDEYIHESSDDTLDEFGD